MGLKVKLHRRAERDLQDIHDHLLKESSAPTAERVRAELRRSIRRLSTRPFLLGRPTRGTDIRILSLTRYPYRVY